MCLTLPILIGLDGVRRMGKSLGNYVGVNMPPGEQFGRTMSIADPLMRGWFTLLTDRSPEEITALTSPEVTRPDLAKIVDLNVGPKEYWLYTNSPFDNQKKREALDRYGLEKGLEFLTGPRTSGDQKGAPCH